ncbi:hypothetical protein PHMEG_00027824 [Phytophthora megakarya]|uniref:Uncharacterized protein n=1 Tax=Phytophthora megakarya TaxID=4795 RepID=A0A225V7F2_9STRA|nr:hypothetical protein PHMEG_00027824 [Phytophthora megakarya]
MDIVNRVKKNALPDIKALFQNELRVKMIERDVEARIMKDKGLTECSSGAEGTHEKRKPLVVSLVPATLKQEVKQCVCFAYKSAAIHD